MAVLLFGVLLVLRACILVLSFPISDHAQAQPLWGSPCTKLDQRREWRDLTVEQRHSYIQAVLCFLSLPARNSAGGATSRFEEFQQTHIAMTDSVHFDVGQFIPWHRHYVTLYTNALRAECGYDGPGTYWHWARDVDSGLPMEQWPIFDADFGFGGDGVPGTYTLPPDPDNIGATASPSPEMLPPALVYKGCVQDGPFANLTLHLGPGKLLTERCLVRGFHPLWRRQLDSAAVNRVLASKNFEEFRVNIDQGKSGLHGGGHPIVGGEMSNLYSAAGDPIFFTHHGNLDRMWWLWQNADPERRMYDISGPASRDPNSTQQTTLDYELVYPGSGHSVKIRDIMDTSLEPNCFTYEP